MPGYYTAVIRQELENLGAADVDPRHVEAYIRLEHPTLDHLTPFQFAGQTCVALECVRICGPLEAEDLAQSFGL